MSRDMAEIHAFWAGPFRFAARATEDIDRGDSSDLDDIQAIVNGDPNRYARIVARYQPMISKYMWHFSHVPADHERLVHDVFVDAYFGLKNFRGDGPLLHWLRKIATRVGYRHWKSNAAQTALGNVSLESHHEEVAAGHAPRALDERAEVLQAAMNSLRPRDRVVLTLLYIEGISVRDAAAALGWSETLVRVQAHRARRRLEKILDRLVEPGSDE